MQDLLRYPSVIFDANCLVYFCFRVQDSDVSGLPVIIHGPHTNRARQIVTVLVQNGKSALTIRRAWDETERILVSRALEGLISEGFIQQQMRLKGQVSHALKLRLAQGLKRELASLKANAWFQIVAFVPAPDRSEAVKEVYRQFCANPAYHKRIPPNKGNPSDIDIALVLYSGRTVCPLITNDEELYSFAVELKAHGFCESIRAFNSVRIN